MSPMDRQRQKRLDAAFGVWVRQRLIDQKPERWTQQRLRDELAQRGYEVKREWVNQVINGEHASDELRDAIELVLGRFVPPADIEAQDTDGLVAAIAAQTAAMSSLTDAILLLVIGSGPAVDRANRLMDDYAADRGTAMEQMLAQLRANAAERALRAHEAGEGPPARSVPRETVG